MVLPSGQRVCNAPIHLPCSAAADRAGTRLHSVEWKGVCVCVTTVKHEKRDHASDYTSSTHAAQNDDDGERGNGRNNGRQRAGRVANALQYQKQIKSARHTGERECVCACACVSVCLCGRV